MTHVLIAGGGIGGLTAALTLHARGIESTVLERASHLRPLGVGINLLPHAVSELSALGLGDELAQKAVAPTSISYYDTEGSLLFREPRGVDGGYGYPQFSVHRGQLQMLLLSALRERLGPKAVRTGAELHSFVETESRARAHFGRRFRGRRAGGC
jgi:2-polyprenyl-6-methoxyphenol hydroxylase-like FAD-dependent oxidoreductase